MLTPLSANEGRPRKALAAVNIDPRTLAVDLVVGPLTAHSLARGIEWFTGCDMTGLHGSANQMLRTWARIGQTNKPYQRVTRPVLPPLASRPSPGSPDHLVFDADCRLNVS
jgi:hypothetical protein